jgi:uncharacterized protein (TIGR03066 family)
MRAILGCGLAVALAVAAGAPAQETKGEKIDAKKLIGKWQPAEKKDKEAVTIEFAKDGKLYLTADFGGKAEKLEGTYKLDGNKLTVGVKLGDKEQTETVTVTRLTDDELMTEDSKGKKETLKKITK